jgi:histidine phosphotransferase ChpT
MNDLELASLLVSRVCHDLVSPVGAVINGLEVIEDDDDPGMREQALQLIGRSATQASAKLQFARLAFGAMGSRGDRLPIGDVKSVAELIYADSKSRLVWTAPDMELPKAQTRSLANLVALALDCLPRGGTVTVHAETGRQGVDLVVRAQGQGARLTDELSSALSGQTPLDKIDGKAVLPLVLGLLVRSHGGRVVTDIRPDDVTLAASYPS